VGTIKSNKWSGSYSRIAACHLPGGQFLAASGVVGIEARENCFLGCWHKSDSLLNAQVCQVIVGGGKGQVDTLWYQFPDHWLHICINPGLNFW